MRKHRNCLRLGLIIGFPMWLLAGIPEANTQSSMESTEWESINGSGMQAYEHGQHSEAKALFLQALDHLEAGPEQDPRRAMTLNNLAAVHKKLGEYEEAEMQYRHSLTIIEGIQGPLHPDVVLGLNNLASLYEHQGQMSKAEPLRRRALTLLENVLGAGHPHLVPPLLTLASVVQTQGRWSEAEQFYIQTLRITEHSLGSQHPQLATILERYAQLLRQSNREEEAHMLEKQASSIRSSHSNTKP